MTTHLTTTPTLLQRIRDCQAVVVLRESTLESVTEDHEARAARRLGTFRTAPAEVLKGSDEGELTIRMLSIEGIEGSAEQPAWRLSPEADRPQVAFLVRENHTSWVPYFSSVFPLDGEHVLLPDDVEDDRPDRGSLDLTELRALITRSAEEARERQTKLWEAEPEIAARTEPHPVLETPEAPAPGATSAAPDVADPGGSASEPGGPATGPGAPQA
ncbi:hypothetical protein HLK59_19540 [Streptomyces sp. S3(2020)]|uniref:hypothetical protein n=1 Tax=Streptomyces sp. S3(2020) TaxID=2732044 RepID=UPI0014884058|nr:hypothetical protein [Streptomyces sp. S3(2020)]NNN32515.1 hypothetical protein [Streptomyces sp. S3(2020)]